MYDSLGDYIEGHHKQVFLAISWYENCCMWAVCQCAFVHANVHTRVAATVLCVMRRLVDHTARELFGRPPLEGGWTLEKPKVARQPNGVDCGVCTLLFAEAVLRGNDLAADLDFSSEPFMLAQRDRFGQLLLDTFTLAAAVATSNSR